MEFTDSVHTKFRTEIRAIARKRTMFDSMRKAFYRVERQGAKRYLKGVHRTVAKAFGSLHNLIRISGGGAANTGGKTRSPTSRGTRLGRELCRWIGKGPNTPMPKSMHPWCGMVVTALKTWGIHLIDGEVAVSRGHMATGVDLLGVRYDEGDLTWRLVCIELKSGYKGAAWTKPCGGFKDKLEELPRTIKNYALTQLQLTQLCAEASLNQYVFEKPLLIRVNDQGVSKSSPTPAIEALCKRLIGHRSSKKRVAAH